MCHKCQYQFNLFSATQLALCSTETACRLKCQAQVIFICDSTISKNYLFIWKYLEFINLSIFIHLGEIDRGLQRLELRLFIWKSRRVLKRVLWSWLLYQGQRTLQLVVHDYCIWLRNKIVILIQRNISRLEYNVIFFTNDSFLPFGNTHYEYNHD